MARQSEEGKDMTTEAEIRRIFPLMAQSQIDAIMKLSDDPREPDHINPLGQSERDLALADIAQHQRSLNDPKGAIVRDIPEPLLQFFTRDEQEEVGALRRSIAYRFANMAEEMVRDLPRNPERTVALRKLLEARDCAMRAAVMK